MLPGKQDLELYRGDSYDYRFILWADLEQTEPVDLAGATAKAEIRDKSGGTVIMSFDCSIVQPNTVDVSIKPTMYVVTPKKAVWDLQVTFPNGAVRTQLYGTVKFTGDVTDSA